MPELPAVLARPWARVSAPLWRHPWRTAAGALLAMALLGAGGYYAEAYLGDRAEFRAVQHALDRRDWPLARKRAEAYLRLRPDSPDGHRLAARTARRVGLLDEADAQLDRCRQLGGDTRALEIEQALLKLRRGDLSEPEGFLRECVAENDPDTAEILDCLSEALILDYRFFEAQRCLDELLRRRPDDFDMLVRRARTAQNQALFTESVDSLQRAIDLRPDAEDVRLSLAQGLEGIGRYPEAVEQLNRLRGVHSLDPNVLFTLARCQSALGRKEQARELLDRVLVHNPRSWEALSERGALALELDRPREAEPDLLRAQALAPREQQVLARLADCLRLLGKEDEARRYRDEADRLRADSLLLGRLLEQYHNGASGNADLCHQLGSAFLRLGKDQEALRFFQKALKCDPNHRPTLETLATFRLGAVGSSAAR
jgi:tetratricopeptide (TPR) repeat protein